MSFLDKSKVSKQEREPLVFSNPRKMAEHTKLPLWRKLGYAVGGMPYTMCNVVMGYYLTFFLLEVALLGPTYVLMIVLLGRIWDAISDPLCGYLCSRTKTKLGQFRPWLLLSAFPTAVVYFFLWFVPHFKSQYMSFLYYLAMYLLMQTMLTCVHVPYTSLTMHLSYNQKETDSVTVYRIVFEMLGTLIGMGIYTGSYTVFVHGDEQCIGERTWDIEKERAFRYHAVVAGALMVVMILTTFFTVKEQKEITVTKTKLSIWSALKETWGFRPYRDLFLIELFSWLAIQFGQGNFAFYAKYNLKIGDNLPYFIFFLLVINVFWLPPWQLFLKRFGKKTAFLWGAWIMMPSYLGLLYIDFYPNLIWALALAIGAGAGAIYLLPWSMLPDVVDSASLKNGVRREELYYSFFVFGNKFSSGITLAISTGFYKLVGYDQLSCEQPWAVPLLFKLLISCPPVVFILLSLIFLWRYPIDESRRLSIREKLKTKRKHIADHQAAEGQDTFNTPPVSSSTSGISSYTESDCNHTSDECTLEGELQIDKM